MSCLPSYIHPNVFTRLTEPIGASVWILMQSVGEIATLFPVHGGFVEVYEISANANLSRLSILLTSFIQHCDRFVDPAFSFAVSWLYYFMWSVFLASGECHQQARNDLHTNRVQKIGITPRSSFDSGFPIPLSPFGPGTSCSSSSSRF